MIYLAGAIDAAGEEAALWREEARRALASRGLSSYDPRGAFTYANEADAQAVEVINAAALEASDGVLAEFWLPCPHAGTLLEILRALELGLPVVAVTKGKRHVALRTRGVHMTDTLEAGVEAIAEAVKTGGERPDPQEGWERAHPLSLKVKLEAGGMLPLRYHPGDAGLDLVTAETVTIPPGETRDLPTALSVAMPPGVWGLIFGRSSALRKLELLVNPGVIDNGWRGPLFVNVKNLAGHEVTVRRGERVGQLILIPMAGSPRLELVDELPPSKRGDRGFGSTGW